MWSKDVSAIINLKYLLTDINYVLQILMHKLKDIIFLFFLFCNSHVTNGIFQPGKEYIYSYNALSSSGVLLPSGASSSWGFSGKLKIQAEQNVATMQVNFITDK